MSDKRRRLRIPSRIKLPFGFMIHIQALTHEAWVENYHVIFSDELDAETQAYCKDTEGGMTIYLDRSRGLRRMRADLCHEMIHAVAEWQAAILSRPGTANPVG